MKPFRLAFLFFFVACSCWCVYNFTVMIPRELPVQLPEACSARANASQLLSQQVSVVYILLGQRKTYFKKFPVEDLEPEDRQLFAVEKAYRQAWEAAGVVSVMSEDATFVISKQQNARLLDLCREYPRHQVFNHLDFVQPITVKSRLAAAARRFAARAKWRAKEIANLMPASYILRNPRDCHEFRDQVMSGMWIHKKDRTHNSQGVRLLTSQEAQGFAKSCGNESSRGLVQRYLPNPLLIHDRKCDFRIFLYIPSSVPLVAFSSPVWYMRCGHEKFNLSSTDPQNVVTNTKVNGKLRKGANYSELVLGPKQVQAILSQQGFDSDFVQVQLAAKIKQKLTLLMEVLESQAAHLKTTGYELLGVDMMLTSDLNLWLIEVNSSPGMESSLGARQTAVDYMLPLVVGSQRGKSQALASAPWWRQSAACWPTVLLGPAQEERSTGSEASESWHVEAIQVAAGLWRSGACCQLWPPFIGIDARVVSEAQKSLAQYGLDGISGPLPPDFIVTMRTEKSEKKESDVKEDDGTKKAQKNDEDMVMAKKETRFFLRAISDQGHEALDRAAKDAGGGRVFEGRSKLVDFFERLARRHAGTAASRSVHAS